MDSEIIKKLEEISAKISGTESRLDKIENFAVKLSQKVLDMQRTELPRSDVASKSVSEPSHIKAASDRVDLPAERPVAPVFKSNILPHTIFPGFVWLVVAYVSIYMMEGFGLIFPGTSFLLMIAVLVCGGIGSIKTKSYLLPFFTAVLAFLSPYLFGLRAASPFVYFIYLLALNIWIGYISYFKGRRSLSLIGLLGTVSLFGVWHFLYYMPGDLAIALYAISSFYLIFLGVNILNRISLPPSTGLSVESLILVLNPAWLFTGMYILLKPVSEIVIFSVAVFMSVVYISFTYLFKFFRRDDHISELLLGSVSAVFLTIAVPVIFEGNNITIVWSIEAVLIAILGAIMKNDGMEVASLSVFAGAVLSSFLPGYFGVYQDLAGWTPILNKDFFSYLIMIFSGTIIAYILGYLTGRPPSLVRVAGGQAEKSDFRVIASLWAVVNILVIVAISAEIYRYFDKASFDLSNLISQEVRLLELRSLLGSEGISDVASGSYEAIDAAARFAEISNRRNIAITVFWLFYALTLSIYGTILRSSLPKQLALLVFVAGIIKIFTFDLSGFEALYRVLALMAITAMAVITYLSFLYQRTVTNLLNPGE